MSNTGVLLLVILILLMLAAFPGLAPWASAWGMYPAGLLGILIVVVVVLLVAGKL